MSKVGSIRIPSSNKVCGRTPFSVDTLSITEFGHLLLFQKNRRTVLTVKTWRPGMFLEFPAPLQLGPRS